MLFAKTLQEQFIPAELIKRNLDSPVLHLIHRGLHGNAKEEYDEHDFDKMLTHPVFVLEMNHFPAMNDPVFGTNIVRKKFGINSDTSNFTDTITNIFDNTPLPLIVSHAASSKCKAFVDRRSTWQCVGNWNPDLRVREKNREQNSAIHGFRELIGPYNSSHVHAMFGIAIANFLIVFRSRTGSWLTHCKSFTELVCAKSFQVCICAWKTPIIAMRENLCTDNP